MSSKSCNLSLFVVSHDNVIFATTQHGGHLGFFEGGLLYPDTITWLDKIVVQYSNAMVNTVGKAKQFQSLPSSTSIDKLLNTSSSSTEMSEKIEAAQKSQLQGKSAAAVRSEGELRKRGFTVEDGRKNEEHHVAPLLMRMDPPPPPCLTQSSSQLLSQWKSFTALFWSSSWGVCVKIQIIKNTGMCNGILGVILFWFIVFLITGYIHSETTMSKIHEWEVPPH